MSVSHAAPSPFAALLRRSKFATYDPHIGQVYTTHGGHAFRGNWGLKRPLPNRRRVGFITVRSVDTPEQQTEWNSAESSARWMRRWEEIGKKLEVEEVGNPDVYARYGWPIDSEFDRAGAAGLEPGRELRRESQISYHHDNIPDFEAMSNKGFEKYLDYLRTLRPKFKRYLAERWIEQQQRLIASSSRNTRRLPSEMAGVVKVTGSGEVDMYASSMTAGNLHVNNFLAGHLTEELNSGRSTRIQQKPHRNGGLEYAFMSALQSQYLHKPSPGRDITQSRAERFKKAVPEKKADLIAVGGLIGELQGVGARTIVPTDFGTQDMPRRNREQGKGLFRLGRVRLERKPLTVGHAPEKADHAQFRMIEFRTAEMPNANSSNPHPLGSMEYVGWKGINQPRGGMPIPGRIDRMTNEADAYRRKTSPVPPSHPHVLLKSLSGMIKPPN